jgi:hypothetical protein
VLVQHLESADIAVLQGDKLELHHFPELDDGVDLLLHLGLVLGDLAYLLNGLLVVEQTIIPQ